jgi:hypothetical protein
MALITVYSILQRSQEERRWMRQQAEATVRVADALEAMLAKLNEPDPEVPPALSAEIKEAVAEAEELKQAQESPGA